MKAGFHLPYCPYRNGTPPYLTPKMEQAMFINKAASLASKAFTAPTARGVRAPPAVATPGWSTPRRVPGGFMRVAMTIAWAGAGAAAAVPAQAGQFQFHVLNIPGEAFSAAFTINDNNQAVGSYMDGSDVVHGLVWQNGQTAQVDAIGSYRSRLVSINAQGIAVGDFGAVGGGANAFTYNLRTAEQTVVGAIDGLRYYQGLGITSADAVYGSVTTKRDPYEAYVAKADVVRKFNVAGAAYTVISTISDRGEVLGSYVPPGKSPVTHGFTLRGGVLTSFDAPGATSTLPALFGAHGIILGSFQDANGVSHGFVRQRGGYTVYDHPGATGTTLIGMSGNLLVGNFSTAESGSTGFFYDGKTYTDLSILGAEITGITSINAGGSITGTFFAQGNGQLYGFIAICSRAPCTK